MADHFLCKQIQVSQDIAIQAIQRYTSLRTKKTTSSVHRVNLAQKTQGQIHQLMLRRGSLADNEVGQDVLLAACETILSRDRLDMSQRCNAGQRAELYIDIVLKTTDGRLFVCEI